MNDGKVGGLIRNGQDVNQGFGCIMSAGQGEGNLSFNFLEALQLGLSFCRDLRVTTSIPTPKVSHSLHPTANRSQSDPSSPISDAKPLS